jgi:hypothetical protein
MTVDAIFAQALAKSTPAERTTYLDEACAHDLALRQRVEALLQSHEAAGDFLGKPAFQCAAEELAGQARAGDTQGELPADDGGAQALDFLAPSDKPDSLGRLGHYEVLEVIGRGGMGIVLRAVDEKLQRVVAIKVMAAQLATNATARKRFTREAQAAAAVTHDHIVTIHAVEEANGLPYLVMQYVSGMSLQQRLDRTGPLELREIVRIGMQTAAGLAAAHAHGLIHRDIKPANILLENGVERVKITDFGLARAVADASLTQSGVVAGTPQYMSPEQARGEAVDQRTDLFSLGSVLYAMCAGRPPFRATTGIAVLKRVCEDTPTPIKEINAEIPEWLAEIVTKLHAKDPADRFQSAAEAAELLNRHLAHLQHPSVVGQPGSLSRSVKVKQGQAGSLSYGRRRWAVAAAVILFLLGGLSLTEAAGVTSLRATVIRIFTPEGMLVVEVDDPGVKVTIEGDGGIVITGAGLQEVRLKPGSYKVHAAKDGKPVRLDQELVTITRGDKHVVRVRLEGEAAAAKIAAKGEPGAFVLLGAKNAFERKFDTLAEAVQRASDGDTIEVRGNGPFASSPVDVVGTALTIRAGDGYRPVLIAEGFRVLPDQLPYFLRSDSRLVLEGLEFHQFDTGPIHSRLISVSNGSLYVAHCRLLSNCSTTILADAPPVEVRHCELLGHPEPGTWIHLHLTLKSRGRIVLENNIAAGHAIGVFFWRETDLCDSTLELRRNTFLALEPITFAVDRIPDGPGPNRTQKPVRVIAIDNVLDGRGTVLNLWFPNKNPLPPRDAEVMLQRVVDWQGRQNVYSALPAMLTSEHKPLPTVKGMQDWMKFWATEVDALESRPKYQGGNLLTKTANDLKSTRAADFRLRPDSAGYRAGKDGKDLGADIDLVGPGKAYERWKKTPDYQQWLKDTAPLTSAARNAEPARKIDVPKKEEKKSPSKK